jgi:PAS domain S-box-containing protein
VDSPPSIVRIVLLQPETGGIEAAPLGPRPGPRVRDTAAALGRIGGDVEFELVSDLEGCRRFGQRSDIDLVVFDRCPRDFLVEALEIFAASALPLVVVTEADAAEERALEAFRLGATDCVRAGDDYAEVLPVVALEQIRRWRQLRERRAAHDKIEWLEKLQQAIISEIPVSLIVVEAGGRVLDVNPEFSRGFDVSAKRAKGAQLEDLLPLDMMESGRFSELMSEGAASDSRVPRLVSSVDAAGERRVFDLRSKRLDEEGRVLLVLSDVSETEILARRVGELEHYTENIIQNINSALLLVDLLGRISFANPTAGKILAVDCDQLVGRPIADWFGDAETGESLVTRCLENGARYKGAETMITLDDGVVLPIGISCTPLLGESGAVRGAVAIFQDLSEIKQLQRQVLQTEKMASIGQLAAGVAHEINNPMGFIHANLYQMSEYLRDLEGYWQAVDELRDAAGSGAPDAARRSAAELEKLAKEIDLDFLRADFGKAVRESQEGSERIRHIVRDLREFSHQGSGERTLADVNQCVDSTASIVWTMMKHSVVLEKEYQDLPPIRCHPMQLKQVFMNLLVNAYQAIDELVGNSGDQGVIRIETSTRAEGVVITISDTGVGIPRANQARIFDPFFTTKEVGAGTGLGLSTSYGIVERHGGTMTVTSEPGCGSSFEVWLPLGSALDEQPKPIS